MKMKRIPIIFIASISRYSIEDILSLESFKNTLERRRLWYI